MSALAEANPSSPIATLEHPSAPAPERTWLWLGAMVLASLLPRMLVFPFAENLYGDAVIRTELAQRWAAHPHWIASFADGAFQFGPLQLYLVGLVLKLGVDKEIAGRLVSLAFGTASVVPLFLLTRRLLSRRHAVVACLAFSLWGMHLQMSSTAGSEALALFLVLTVVALLVKSLDENRFALLFAAAMVLNLACATRYDCWLLVLLIPLLLMGVGRDRVAAVTRAVGFGLLSLPFPLVWMQGNELAKGSAFYPIRYIEDFHHAWVQDGIARWGQLGYRAQNLVFWPAVALLTLSPLVAYFGFRGMARFWREKPERRWVLWLAWTPTAYFTFRGAVLLDFVPLARFAVNQVVFVLPFVALGFEAQTERSGPWVRRGWAVASVFTAVLAPVLTTVATTGHEDGLASSLRPVSPLSQNPGAVMEVARFLKAQAARPGSAVILDTDSRYWDLQLAFYSGLPEERIARYRWDIFDQRLQTARPDLMVLSDQGTLAKDPRFVDLGGNEVRFAGQPFRLLPGFSAPFHVYRRTEDLPSAEDDSRTPPVPVE